MKKIDMSEKAVWRRLKQVDQLHELCLALMKAGKAIKSNTGAHNVVKNNSPKVKQDSLDK